MAKQVSKIISTNSAKTNHLSLVLVKGLLSDLLLDIAKQFFVKQSLHIIVVVIIVVVVMVAIIVDVLQRSVEKGNKIKY